MITNKERLEQLIEQIKRLEILTEEIRDKDIYPVSFFSQAFDIANKLPQELNQIELFQIELIEKQRKEHQAQLFSQEEMILQKEVIPPANNVQEPAIPAKVAPLVHLVQEEKKVIPSHMFEQKNLIDLKKMITLNDRFLFCREMFANNEQLMNQVLNELNMEESYNSSVEYLQKRFDWDFENKNVTNFLVILKKKFT